MNRVYFDNAATSFPKAKNVGQRMCEYIECVGTNVSRGTYEEAYEASEVIYETRELICELFNFDKTENVIFTKNITESLNVLIRGIAKEDDHFIVSSMEHNAIKRPLNFVKEELNITFDECKCDKEGSLNALDIKKLIKPNTKAVIMTHASNICGTILDLEKVGQICKENNIFFIIDAAQTAGFLDLDINKLNANAIAFTGHKSLLGPNGIGGFIIDDELNKITKPLITGGTGSASDLEVQPDYMPDKFESGTPNIVGIYGLNESLKYILNKGIKNIREYELDLFEYFINRLNELEGFRILGTKSKEHSCPVISLDFNELDNAVVSHTLASEYNISNRCGLHCAPSAHKTLDTYPQGSVRFSLGHENTKEEIDYTIDALKKILLEQ